MKALVFEAPNLPLQIREVPTPLVNNNEEEVVVKVAGCGVCHTDISFWKDGVPTKKSPPLILGHEISGTVTAAGNKYQHLVGNEVIVPAVIPCGDCILCKSGRSNICRKQMMPGNDIDGGFAEFIKVPARYLCPVTSKGEYSLAELSVVADAVTTPYQAVLRSGLREKDLAIIVGTGGVGGFCVQIASAFGAKVIALDVDDNKLTRSMSYGANHTFNPAKVPLKELKKNTQILAADWGCPTVGWKIFECTGHPAGQETAYGLLTHAATLMVVGFTMEKISVRLGNLMAFDATAQGTWGCRAELYPDALRMVTDGKVQVKPFVELFSLSQGPAILQKAAEGLLQKRAVLIPR